MGLKIHILSLLALFHFTTAFTEEKFLNVSGVLVDEDTKEELTDYSVKIVQDRIDSATSKFSKSEFQIWAPANRRSVLYFIKEGYVVKQVFIDASYIPSIAFKKKQAIELKIEMTRVQKAGKRDFSKPIMTATYSARENAFGLIMHEAAYVAMVPDDYTPPFPAPVDTYKGVQPASNTLGLTAEYNTAKAKPGSEYCSIIQGILFADMNYCFFNERTNDANRILETLVSIDPERWGNLKSFDSPEYGRIIMRTVNREQSVDTLFALGSFVETSRLIFQNFTSDSKILVHLKKLRDVMLAYVPVGLTEGQAAFVSSLRTMAPMITDLESKYTESLRNRSGFILNEDPQFVTIRSQTEELYARLIE